MIAVVDVCSGNLRSVERALEKVGADVVVTRDPETVRRADKIVVPGQGAFGVFMKGLVERGLGDALREAIASGRPYLGICLGLQVLFDESEEQGPCAGLGILRGRVAKLAPSDPRLKVPHMGWNRLRVTHDREPLLEGVPQDAYVYFVHSYHAVPADRSLVALEADHGIPITAAIRKDNLFACQFHPEKSQTIGLQILRNFVEAR
ncbi:MAG: imidazole glycerol phosphate synthase subunit HisH [Myxococcota bacterium]|nr:imidazole glycerol phosphate synthase subunit HisH [Deltaproteobacteria bacterium]MDQ3338583.1 imidazole glycerol phosphate synthase subunit HisH [Myxococcota bacterium]